jgi:hypothetical protein
MRPFRNDDSPSEAVPVASKGGDSIMWAMLIGIAIMVASWLPLQIVTANDPTSIPFELGIMSMLGVFVGGVVAVVGFVKAFIRTVRDANRNSGS